MGPTYSGRLWRRQYPLMLLGIEPRFRGRPAWMLNCRGNGGIDCIDPAEWVTVLQFEFCIAITMFRKPRTKADITVSLRLSDPENEFLPREVGLSSKLKMLIE